MVPLRLGREEKLRVGLSLIKRGTELVSEALEEKLK
jgi:hypothetical protein